MVTARSTVFAITFALGAILLPHLAAASTDAWARAQPEKTTPGAEVLLVFGAPAPPLLDANVVEHVACTLIDAKGAQTPCGSQDQLVDAHVTPADSSYSFKASAPQLPGNYTVRFTRASLLSLPSTDASATTTLIVSDASLDAAHHEDSSTGSSPPGVSGKLASLAGTHTGRWLASVLFGTATIAGCVVATRGRGGFP